VFIAKGVPTDDAPHSIVRSPNDTRPLSLSLSLSLTLTPRSLLLI
jgi:hypothetical protein